MRQPSRQGIALFSVRIQFGEAQVLKHMGWAPITAKLYVISGKLDGDEALKPYSQNRALSDRNVAKFKDSLHSCNGGHARVGEATIWCFQVEQSKIKRKTGVAQNLGVVTDDDGPRFGVYAVDFDYISDAIEVEIRAAP